jgi:hypothetical protein
VLVIGHIHKTGIISFGPLRWASFIHSCKDLKGGRKPINAKREIVHLPRGSVVERNGCSSFSFAFCSGGLRQTSLLISRAAAPVEYLSFS